MNLLQLQTRSKASCRGDDYLATREELRIIDAAMASIDAGESGNRLLKSRQPLPNFAPYEAGLFATGAR